MRRFSFILLSLALLVTPLFWACGRPAAPGHPASPGKSARVVSLSPSLTDILVELGAGPQIVGSCGVPGRPPLPEGAPAVASWGTVDLERVVALKPTLCVTAEGMQDPQVLWDLRRAGVPLVQYRQETLEELWASMEDLGARVGKAERGRQLAASCRARVEAARGKASSPAPRALLLVGDDPVVVAGTGTLGDELLRAGGCSDAACAERGYAQVDLERIVLSKPDLLFFPEGDLRAAPVGALADRVGRIAGRRPLPVGIAADILVRPGPGTPEAVERIAAARMRWAAGTEAAGGAR